MIDGDFPLFFEFKFEPANDVSLHFCLQGECWDFDCFQMCQCPLSGFLRSALRVKDFMFGDGEVFDPEYYEVHACDEPGEFSLMVLPVVPAVDEECADDWSFEKDTVVELKMSLQSRFDDVEHTRDVSMLGLDYMRAVYECAARAVARYGFMRILACWHTFPTSHLDRSEWLVGISYERFMSLAIFFEMPEYEDVWNEAITLDREIELLRLVQRKFG